MGTLEAILVVGWLLFRLLLVIVGVLFLCFFTIALIKSYIDYFGKERRRKKHWEKVVEGTQKAPTGNITPPLPFGEKKKTTQRKEDVH